MWLCVGAETRQLFQSHTHTQHMSHLTSNDFSFVEHPPEATDNTSHLLYMIYMHMYNSHYLDVIRL